MTLENKAFEFYISGCNPPHCEKCFNPETWDFNNGKLVDEKYLNLFVSEIDGFEDLFDKFYILGGEPLHQDLNELYNFIKFLKDIFNKEIWLFTRVDFKDVPDNIKNVCDYIKCGRYDINNLGKKDYYGVILQSLNQKIYKKGTDYNV